MKKIQLWIILIMIGLALTNCGNGPEKLSDEDFQEVKFNNEYSLKLPKYLKKTDSLQTDSSVTSQYKNLEKRVYVVVFGENKGNNAEVIKELKNYNEKLSVVQNYRDFRLKYLKDVVNVTKVHPAKSVKINGMNAEIVAVDGVIDHQKTKGPIAYTIAFIEGKDKMYSVLTWTNLEKRPHYENTFEKILMSFKQ